MQKSNTGHIHRQIIQLQLIVAICCILITAIISKNLNSVVSASIGAAIVVLITLAYSKIALVNDCIAYPKVALKRHKLAMLARFLLNMLLFAVVIIFYRHCNFVALFATYLISLTSYWLWFLRRST